MEDLGKVIPGLVRDMVGSLGGMGFAAGYIDGEGWKMIGGACAVLVAAVWTYMHRKAVADAAK